MCNRRLSNRESNRIRHWEPSTMGHGLSSFCGLVRSIAGRLYRRSEVIGLIVCICSALVGVEGWQLWHVYHGNIHEAEVVTATTARSLAEQANTSLKTADSIVAALVERVEAEGTGPEAKVRLYHLMTSLASELPAIHEMGVTNDKGDAIVKSLVANPVGLNYAERSYFRYHATHTDRGPFIGGRIKSKIDGSYAITVTRRLNHPDGSFGGVVVTSVSMKFFEQLFDEVQARSGGVIALLSDDGAQLARSPAIDSETSPPVVGSELWRRVLKQPDVGTLSYLSPIDGVMRYGSYRHLGQFPLITLVAHSEWDVQSTFRSQLAWNGVTLVLVLIAVAVMGSRAVKANRLLNAQAMQDGLTGLANRRLFEDMIRSEFRRAERMASPLSVIMIDIDHFKDYNDCYGHLAGDECLRSVANAIRGCVRRAGDLAARYGGEEIVIILPNLDNLSAVALATTMRTAVHSLALPHAHSQHSIVTFSAGVATQVPGQSVGGWEMLVEEADAALYAAKASGRDTVENAVAWRPVRQSVHAAESSPAI
jgi:diguanylate cyclase (GGDEF)-like protein